MLLTIFHTISVWWLLGFRTSSSAFTNSQLLSHQYPIGIVGLLIFCAFAFYGCWCVDRALSIRCNKATLLYIITDWCISIYFCQELVFIIFTWRHLSTIFPCRCLIEFMDLLLLTPSIFVISYGMWVSFQHSRNYSSEFVNL